eukprot:scaffold2276_cov82-Cylindrotheca_fusiformis.AAC.6
MSTGSTSDSDDEEEEIMKGCRLNWLAAVANAPPVLPFYKNYIGRPTGSVVIPRQRKNMEVLFTEIGPVVFRRMYRMEEITFKRLLSILEPLFNLRKRKRGMTPNGEVMAMARLSMAIRWAADLESGDCKVPLPMKQLRTSFVPASNSCHSP